MAKLRPLAPDLWEATDLLRVPGGVVFPIRMTVLRTHNGLVLWSPIAIDDPLAEEIDALGDVHFIAAPNKLHHLFAAAAKTRWPAAELLAAPGLREKRTDVAFDGELLEADLGDGVDLALIRGVPFMNEVVLFHRASKTLVVTDLVFHILEATTFMSWFTFRVVAGTLGRLGQSRLVRFMVKDPQAYEGSVREMLAWDFDRVVMAHGEVVEAGGPTLLTPVLLRTPTRSTMRTQLPKPT